MKGRKKEFEHEAEYARDLSILEAEKRGEKVK